MNVDHKNPLECAKFVVDQKFRNENHQPLLRYYKNDFFTYVGTHYELMEQETLRSIIYLLMGGAYDLSGSKFNLSKKIIDEIIEALKATLIISNQKQEPFWFNGCSSKDECQYLCFLNGILNLKTFYLESHSSDYFCFDIIPFPFLEIDLEAIEWSKFLNSVWEEDLDSITIFQEWLGLLLTRDTSFQKSLLIIGPKRSGKGTIGRLLNSIIGRGISNPTTSGLIGNFGLAPLINKKVALISDARFAGSKSDLANLAEIILRLTGEDSFSIPRKFKSNWEGKLFVRLVIFSNELPYLSDASGALASRFSIIKMTKSFFNMEDQKLDTKLSHEIPQIIKWAIDGYKRLLDRGFFLQPQSSVDTINLLKSNTSSISTYLEDRCLLGENFECSVDEIFSSWKTWCQDQNIRNIGTKQSFGRKLMSVLPTIRTVQRGTGFNRERFYLGIEVLVKQEAHMNTLYF